jgi:hypothetical protein
MTSFDDIDPAKVAAYIEGMQRDLAEGRCICPGCGDAVPLSIHGKEWTAECKCGWSACGTGYVPPRFN